MLVGVFQDLIYTVDQKNFPQTFEAFKIIRA